MFKGQEFQDWEQVVFRKKVPKPTDKEAVKEAIRTGKGVETIRKSGTDHRAAAAKKRTLEADLYVSATEAAPEQKPLPKLNTEDRNLMIKARTEKKLTQVQLAQQLNIRPNIIQDIENGKVIENPAILNMINRILGTKLKVMK